MRVEKTVSPLRILTLEKGKVQDPPCGIRPWRSANSARLLIQRVYQRHGDGAVLGLDGTTASPGRDGRTVPPETLPDHHPLSVHSPSVHFPSGLSFRLSFNNRTLRAVMAKHGRFACVAYMPACISHLKKLLLVEENTVAWQLLH